MAPSSDIEKAALYAKLGFGGNIAPYDAALAREGLSPLRKQRISLAKRTDVARVLEERFLPVCNRGDCRAAGPGMASGREVVEAADPGHCAVCGGSATASAIAEMVEACDGAGMRRLCIVGGSPAYHQQLRDLVGRRLDLRIIPGDIARSRKQAGADLQWAQMVVIWGGTILDHKVSSLYESPEAVRVRRRSIQELAAAVKRAAATG